MVDPRDYHRRRQDPYPDEGFDCRNCRKFVHESEHAYLSICQSCVDDQTRRPWIAGGPAVVREPGQSMEHSILDYEADIKRTCGIPRMAVL